MARRPNTVLIYQKIPDHLRELRERAGLSDQVPVDPNMLLQLGGLLQAKTDGSLSPGQMQAQRIVSACEKFARPVLKNGIEKSEALQTVCDRSPWVV